MLQYLQRPQKNINLHFLLNVLLMEDSNASTSSYSLEVNVSELLLTHSSIVQVCDLLVMEIKSWAAKVSFIYLYSLYLCYWALDLNNSCVYPVQPLSSLLMSWAHYNELVSYMGHYLLIILSKWSLFCKGWCKESIMFGLIIIGIQINS